MNITPIKVSFTPQYFNNINTDYGNQKLIKPNYNNSLSKDTVSFTAAKLISDSIWRNFVKELPTLRRIATPFLDAAEAVAKKHEDSGVSFLREMFEETAVKEPDSKLSKVSRAKTFDDRDAIRTTLFVKNPYNLSTIFEKIIPSFGPEEGRNYLVAPIKVSVGDLMKRGYVPIEEEKMVSEFFSIPHTKEAHLKFFREVKSKKYDYYDTKRSKYDYDNVKYTLTDFLKTNKDPSKDEIIKLVKSLKIEVPDVDVRLNKKMLNLNGLPEKYKYCIGEPNGAYEDAQIRFIRYEDKDVENPIYHELLIHFGPTYNRNAFREHKLVYEKTRLFKELNIPVNPVYDGAVDFKLEPEKGVAKFISDVKNLFRTEVSEKLINNGKNEDFFGSIEDNEEIFFDAKSEEKYERWFRNIVGFTKEYYKQEKERASISTLATEQVDKDYRADLNLLAKIKKLLDKTIEEINHEYGLSESK